MSIEIYLQVIKIAGYTIPVTVYSGYVTISCAGDIELWYYRPTLVGRFWDHNSEVGIDIGRVTDYSGEPEIVEIKP